MPQWDGQAQSTAKRNVSYVRPEPRLLARTKPQEVLLKEAEGPICLKPVTTNRKISVSATRNSLLKFLTMHRIYSDCWRTEE